MSPPRTLSLAALTVLELSPAEQVACAAATGYSHVGLRLVAATPAEPQREAVGDTPLVRETEAALRDSGVQVLDVEIVRLRPETDVAAFAALLDTAARLGARHVLVAGHDPDPARLAQQFARLCELAAPLGIVPCIEPMPWTEVPDLLQAARIVRAAAQPNAGLLVDPIHFDRAGSELSDLASIAPAWLPYLQFCDAPAARPTSLPELLRQARADRLLPGHGGLDLRGLLAAMPPAAPLSLEIPLAARLPARQRAALALQATRAWLAASSPSPADTG
ncbi:MAG: sugar phosphate isomerase/epimerase [Burkholderiales bacterium]|nr:sugar phosphate isomerase/epimerase [Burkholderiales bacterium]